MSGGRAAMFHLKLKSFYLRKNKKNKNPPQKVTHNLWKLTEQNVKTDKAAGTSCQKETGSWCFSVRSTNICVDGCCCTSGCIDCGAMTLEAVPAESN